MQSTKLAAGPIAPRTDGDAPTPENSSATTCDDCNERDAAGINPDGRSLCRPCATRSRTLVTDGGHTREEFDLAKELAQDAVKHYSGVDEERATVRHNRHYVFIDTQQGERLPEELVGEIESDAGLRLRAVEPNMAVKRGVRARFRFADDGDDVLDQLASEFQNRHKQSQISKVEYAERGEDQAADFEQGRVLAYQEARSVILSVKDGGRDE